MDDWGDFLRAIGWGEDTPEDQVAPVRRIFDLVEAGVRRLRDGAPEDTARNRLGLGPRDPTAAALDRARDPRIFAQPDRTQVAEAQARELEAAQPLPVPVLEQESDRTLSDQMRRLENQHLAATGQVNSIRPSTALGSFYANPMVQRGRFGLELATDFSPWAIGKDIGLGAYNLLTGDLGEAAGYGLATIPFLGTTAKYGLDSLKPWQRAAANRQITREMLDPENIGEQLIFAPPSYHPYAAFEFGESGPTLDALSRLSENPWDNSLVDIPLLTLSPSSPARRIQLLKEQGLLRGQDAARLEQSLAEKHAEALAFGVPHSALNTWAGTRTLIDMADIHPRLKEVLSPDNPLFPGVFTAHEGRHRGVFGDYLGLQAMPIRLLTAEGTPRQLLDNPLALRQSTYTGATSNPAQLLDAPTTSRRARTQASIAEEIKRELSGMTTAADEAWIDRTIAEGIPSTDQWSGYASDATDDAIEAAMRFGFDPEYPHIVGPFGPSMQDQATFLDDMSRMLYDRPYSSLTPEPGTDFRVPRLADIGMEPGVVVGPDVLQWKGYKDWNRMLANTTQNRGSMLYRSPGGF